MSTPSTSGTTTRNTCQRVATKVDDSYAIATHAGDGQLYNQPRERSSSPSTRNIAAGVAYDITVEASLAHLAAIQNSAQLNFNQVPSSYPYSGIVPSAYYAPPLDPLFSMDSIFESSRLFATDDTCSGRDLCEPNDCASERVSNIASSSEAESMVC